MLRLKTGVLLSICGTLALTSAAFAQAADEPAPSEPQAQNQQADVQPSDASEQPADAPAQNLAEKLGQGTKAEAEHSAEATAHKSLNDPNNQLGTSLQGRTRPIVEANGMPISMWVACKSPYVSESRIAAQLAPLLMVELIPYFLK